MDKPKKKCAVGGCEISPNKGNEYCFRHKALLQKHGTVPDVTYKPCAKEGCTRKTKNQFCFEHRNERTPKQYKTCLAPGCNKKAKDDYCMVHKNNLRTYNSLELPPLKKCSFEGCENETRKDYCRVHQILMTRYGSLDFLSNMCKANGCKQRASMNGDYCSFHQYRVDRFGSPDISGRKCAAPDCEKQVKKQGRIYCHIHQELMDKYDQLEKPSKPIEERYCSAPDCDQKAHALGLCNVHYSRFKRHGSFENLRAYTDEICASPDCTKRAITEGYCTKHYRLLLKDKVNEQKATDNSNSNSTIERMETCTYEGCLNIAVTNGRCHLHPMHRTPANEQTRYGMCKVKGCTNQGIHRVLNWLVCDEHLPKNNNKHNEQQKDKSNQMSR